MNASFNLKMSVGEWWRAALERLGLIRHNPGALLQERRATRAEIRAQLEPRIDPKWNARVREAWVVAQAADVALKDCEWQLVVLPDRPPASFADMAEWKETIKVARLTLPTMELAARDRAAAYERAVADAQAAVERLGAPLREQRREQRVQASQIAEQMKRDAAAAEQDADLAINELKAQIVRIG